MGKFGVSKAAFAKDKSPRPAKKICEKCGKEEALKDDPDGFGKNCAFFREKGKSSVGK